MGAFFLIIMSAISRELTYSFNSRCCSFEDMSKMKQSFFRKGKGAFDCETMMKQIWGNTHGNG